MNTRKSKVVLALLVTLILLIAILAFLPWILASLGIYKEATFDQYSEYGSRRPGLHKGNLFASCSISIIDPCNLTYRFAQVDQKKLEEITYQMKDAGYDDWQKVEDSELWAGNYENGRHDISREGMQVAYKDVDNRMSIWFVYYPSNQTLDVVQFWH